MKGPPRIVVWGTYDLGKPRVRILLQGLREVGVSLHECHADVWQGVEDKSQLKGPGSRLKALGRWLISYPRLIACYLKAPAHTVVLVPYMGHLDVLVLWPLAKLRGASIVWDAFLSLYNTVVEDRRMLGRRHPLSLLLHGWEWLATRAATLTVLDTRAHAGYFRDRYGLAEERLASVFVGVEPDRFARLPPPQPREPDTPFLVLFYGQFIPLHGIDTIVKAARLLRGQPVQWVIIGQGQEEQRIRAMLDDVPLPNLTWLPWVPYPELIDWIRQAHLCLGIFSDSDKAGRVIPNKVFQVLSAGRPLLTRDSPAIRELVSPDTPGIHLVPPNDEQALADAVLAASALAPTEPGRALFTDLQVRIAPSGIARQLLEAMQREAT